MSDGTFRDRWVDEVFRSPLITDAVRVMLLALVRDMDDDGLIEADRGRLAERLCRHPRKISERYKAAQASGFLKKVRSGNRGGANVFQGTLPPSAKGADGRHPLDPERVPVRSTLSGEKGADGRHPNDAGKGATDRHPLSGKDAAPRHPEGEKRVPVRSTSLRSREVDVQEHTATLFGEKDLPPSAGAVAPATVVSIKPPTVNQRAQSLAKIYTALVPLSTYIAVQQIAKKAITTELYTDEQIEDGLRKLATERRPLTANTLRIAIEGPPANEGLKTGTDGRFAPGSGSDVPPRNSYKPENFI